MLPSFQDLVFHDFVMIALPPAHLRILTQTSKIICNALAHLGTNFWQYYVKSFHHVKRIDQTSICLPERFYNGIKKDITFHFENKANLFALARSSFFSRLHWYDQQLFKIDHNLRFPSESVKVQTVIAKEIFSCTPKTLIHTRNDNPVEAMVQKLEDSTTPKKVFVLSNLKRLCHTTCLPLCQFLWPHQYPCAPYYGYLCRNNFEVRHRFLLPVPRWIQLYITYRLAWRRVSIRLLNIATITMFFLWCLSITDFAAIYIVVALRIYKFIRVSCKLV